MPTTFDYAKLNDADRQIADARALLAKLRVGASSTEALQIDSTDKLLAAASSSHKALRGQIGEADDQRSKAIERADRLDGELKVANAARAAAEQQSKAAKEALAAREIDLADTSNRLKAALDQVKSVLQQAEDDRAKHDSRVKLLNDQLALAADRLVSLQGQLDEARAKLNATGRPRIAVSDMLAALGQQLIGVNASRPTDDQPFAGKFVVERLDVELKGGIDLQDGIGVVPPTGDDLKPENTSTIRFTIRPSAELRVADEDTPEST